ncbi:fibulin-7-like isoform X1 [Entelurus aequoreus]|uniref:fibulin-7-like isoform X1 n=2 Tax=Entelurus aequoreus TaxID=161455 RepID=UPI002B1E4B61|nr:fibulin-7-like isoform X1 [Entelurus aequoreus]
MELVWVVMVTLGLQQVPSASAQAFPSPRDLLTSVRQVEKMLAAHEVSFQQHLRSLRKKMSALHNSTLAAMKAANASCPKPEPPAHGHRLGRVFSVGHEVHFLCKPGYELIGPQTQVCLESLRWSGQAPTCRHQEDGGSDGTRSSSLFPSADATPSSPPPSSMMSASSPSPPPAPSSVHPSNCTRLQGAMRCTCDVGFTISGRDNNLCTDIDECRLFSLGQQGRLCVHECANTPGSYRCLCPAGYRIADDGRGCTDLDECDDGEHDCGGEELCVDTHGGFRCMTVACPRGNNATYIKTSPTRCERNPCMLGDKACAKAPNSVSFHFLSVVSNMSTPRVLFRVSAARALGDTLRFGLAGGRGRGHFSVQRSGRQTGTLLLVAPVLGPATLEAEVEMSELERHTLLGRYLTKVTLFVSPYNF